MNSGQQENNLLWATFETIKQYYAQNSRQLTAQEITLTFIRCMLDLVEQVIDGQAAPTEKLCHQAAQAYWLQEDKEIAPVLLLLNNIIESKISYHHTTDDNRLSCISQVLSFDNDHLDDFPDFLERIKHAGLPVNNILVTIKKHFSFLR